MLGRLPWLIKLSEGRLQSSRARTHSNCFFEIAAALAASDIVLVEMAMGFKSDQSDSKILPTTLAAPGIKVGANL